MNPIVIGEAAAAALAAKPAAEALSHMAKGTFDAALAFCGRICNPAADEMGLYFKDKVSHWRAINAAHIAELAEKKMAATEQEPSFCHPRSLYTILEKGSLADDDEVQQAWAGLLAAACNEKGEDDGDSTFINLLSQLSCLHVKIISYIEKESEKRITEDRAVVCGSVLIHFDEFDALVQSKGVFRLERELEYLAALRIIECEYTPKYRVEKGYLPAADVNLTSLGIALYVRSQGFSGIPADFFPSLKPGYRTKTKVEEVRSDLEKGLRDAERQMRNSFRDSF